jgi:hypothetical protein
VTAICTKTCTPTIAVCAACLHGYFGASCTACPGGALQPCNGEGVCNDGLAGTGVCSCFSSFTGPACQYSRTVTCLQHGTPQNDGSCVCDAGYTGAHCDACAPGYAGAPGVFPSTPASCAVCSPSGTCNSHGACASSGCQCVVPYAGPTCGGCAPNYYVYPLCVFCQAATTCNGHGSCESTTGTCTCSAGYTGANCQTAPAVAATPGRISIALFACLLALGVLGTGRSFAFGRRRR